MFQADGSDLLKFRRNELCGSNGFESVENIVNENYKYWLNLRFFLVVSSNLDGLKIHPYNIFQADGSVL